MEGREEEASQPACVVRPLLELSAHGRVELRQPIDDELAWLAFEARSGEERQREIDVGPHVVQHLLLEENGEHCL